MAVKLVTRTSSHVLLIGHPVEQLTGARLPSGRDVMQNFVHYHLSLKCTINDSAQQVYEQLLPFWLKSNLPTRRKDHVIKKLKDLYAEHAKLMKHKTRNNDKDLENQTQFSEKLDMLFDISHAASEQLISIEEDKQFLKMQKESRSGVIGRVDKKKADRDKRTFERKCREAERAEREIDRAISIKVTSNEKDICSEDEETETDETDDDDEEYCTQVNELGKAKRCKTVLTPNIAATLDRTITSVRKATMIMASVINEAGGSSESLPMSKSSMHRHRQHLRKLSAQDIKHNFTATKSVVHWDGKLMPGVSDNDVVKVDRLPVLMTSAVDGSTKLLGVPALPSGTGRDTSQAVINQLQSWNCDSLVVGMCFDTTASNTGRLNGACKLLEVNVGRALLWLACRHHMHEILLSDVFTVCFGPSTGPEILFCKRFRESWDKLHSHEPNLGETPLIEVSASLQSFIMKQLTEKHPRDDYLELLQLAAYMVGLPIEAAVRRPGAVHRARWMAKALYTLKIELLYSGNEKQIKLTGCELLGIQRFNRFVIQIYLQAWFTCNSAVDAPINDLKLLDNLKQYEVEEIRATGIKWLTRHSWYISPEMATLAIFSTQLSCSEKQILVNDMTIERGQHLLTELPSGIADLHISRMFFNTVGLDDSFLSVPVEQWCQTESYKQALLTVNNLPCINDCAERGVALIENCNNLTTDETQKQYVLQVVEKHRKTFVKLTTDELLNI
jgi:hypothetical protein